MSHHSNSTGRRVLVVDDHRLSRCFILSALRQSRCTVKQEETLEGALQRALSWPPDVIVTDLNLPDGTGTQLLARLAAAWPQQATAPAVPRLILLSADDNPTWPGSEPPWSFSRVLRKPCSMQELLVAVFNSDFRAVEEEATAVPKQVFRSLLEQELAQQIAQLDVYITSRRFDRARRVLHRLIASAAIAANPELEASLRCLDRACLQPADTGQLAAAWYDLDVQRRKCTAGNVD